MTSPFWKLLGALPAAAAAAQLAIVEIPIRSAPSWVPRSDSWSLASLVVLGASALASPAAQAIRERRAQRRLQKRSITDRALRGLLIELVKLTDLPFYVLAVHVFVPEKRWSKRASVPKREERLIKFASIKIVDRPRSTNIPWTRGKGVIGQCWEKKKTVAMNVCHEFREYIKGAKGESDWKDETPEWRTNLDWDELERVKNYGPVIAYPVLDDDGHFIACIAVDGPPRQYTKLWGARNRDVEEAMHQASLVVGRTLEGKPDRH